MKKSAKPYVKRQTERAMALTPRQEQMLAIMRQRFGSTVVVDLAPKHLDTVANEMGYKYRGTLQDVLYALREKGYMQSLGGPVSRPKIWRLLPEKDATLPQHIHTYD